MLLKTRIKINKVTNLHNARYCAGMGVEFIGFPFDLIAANSIEDSTFNEISNWLQGVKYVAEITSNKIGHLDEYNINFIQVTDENLANSLNNHQKPIIFKKSLKTNLDIEKVEKVLENLHKKVEFFLLNIFDFNQKAIEKLRKLAKKYPIMLEGNITKENINHLIDTIIPYGIALNSGTEIKTGYNDLDELSDILEKIELD